MLMWQLLNLNEPEVPILSSDSLFVLPTTHVGVEVEIENHNSVNLTSWNRVNEGSVSGFELVLNSPMCGDDLFCALQELNAIEDTPNHFSQRTSVHVHIDIRDMNLTQLFNLLTLSVMFEPVLYNYVAEHRKHNHFCWQLGECSGLINRILDVIRNRNESQSNIRSLINNHWNAGSTKYAGINLSSVPRYGSLEFRMHEGTSSPVAIMRWINILMRLKQYAMRTDLTPLNILETKQNQGIDSIFFNVLDTHANILEYPTVSEDILKGVRVAQDFVHDMSPQPENVVPEGPYRSRWGEPEQALEAPEPVEWFVSGGPSPSF